MGGSFKRAPRPEKPKLAEWGVGDTANMDLSESTLARQRRYGAGGGAGSGRDSYFEVNEKVESAPGPHRARKAIFGPGRADTPRGHGIL